MGKFSVCKSQLQLAHVHDIECENVECEKIKINKSWLNSLQCLILSNSLFHILTMVFATFIPEKPLLTSVCECDSVGSDIES